MFAESMQLIQWFGKKHTHVSGHTQAAIHPDGEL